MQAVVAAAVADVRVPAPVPAPVAPVRVRVEDVNGIQSLPTLDLRKSEIFETESDK